MLLVRQKIPKLSRAPWRTDYLFQQIIQYLPISIIKSRNNDEYCYQQVKIQVEKAENRFKMHKNALKLQRLSAQQTNINF